ncbi:L-asparaginase [Sporosarcina sp. P37]|uniref:asparaginase n=1 Tax=unclassified Sporosarcina TaxID=2647733 RepID=UPI0009C00539|nr:MULTISPECIES: asparaginase [unclassified Sporosarcina]ARD48869.1 L-asparaginase [Sporosarcina sp. P33]ARK25366.1 L-asparaginase [Sporosarcina sp. P37]PID19079.1 asparaginase [Sporosarcina sp. P35]
MEKKKIVMLSTGGTIASKRNPETGLLTAGVMSGEELSKMCDLPETITVDVQSVFQIPSNHMNFEYLYTLKEKIEEVFQNEQVDGIVVTHGTDTLEETAYFLDLVISDDRPVVITGSQRGPTVIGTDAFVNLRQSIILAAHPESRSLGTIALFNERIFSGRYVQKKHASNVDGFTSFGFGYLGIVDQEKVSYYQKPIHRETYTIKNPLPAIDLVKCALGSDGKFIDCASESGSKGIIIEAPGRGHAPPYILDSVKRAVEKGIIVILTTSAEEGEVKTVYDFPGSAWSLQNEGVILASDYDGKKARIKLAVLLAAGVPVNKEYFES